MMPISQSGVIATHEFELDGEYTEFNVSFDFDYYPEIVGFVGGAPENCYPSEPEDWEFANIKVQVADNLWLPLDDEKEVEEALENAMRNALEMLNEP